MKKPLSFEKDYPFLARFLKEYEKSVKKWFR